MRWAILLLILALGCAASSDRGPSGPPSGGPTDHGPPVPAATSEVTSDWMTASDGSVLAIDSGRFVVVRPDGTRVPCPHGARIVEEGPDGKRRVVGYIDSFALDLMLAMATLESASATASVGSQGGSAK